MDSAVPQNRSEWGGLLLGRLVNQDPATFGSGKHSGSGIRLNDGFGVKLLTVG